MTERSHLAALVARFSTARVLCVGDVMIDRFIYGEVDRVSPEAPIPVLAIERESAMPGGAGNVAVNLAALGARATLVAVVGHDPAGEELGRLFSTVEGVEARFIADGGRPTTIKTRYLAGSQQLLRADREVVRALALAEAEALSETAVRALEGAGALVLSDYGKGALTEAVITRLVTAARERKIPVIVDPKGADYRRYRGATLVTPNRHELREASRRPVATPEEIVSAAEALRKEAGVEAILVTRSAEGMTLVSGGGEAHHVPAEAREVFDVSGAGDTVVAVLAVALAVGATPLEATRLANAAAGIVVGKKGTATASADELVAALRAQDLMTGVYKVVSKVDALSRVAAWRQNGARIGFTNGCFDLLHPGHVSLVAQARAACDRLIVGLNSDDSVRRLKGPSRPVQSEAARAAVLASLQNVDLVVIFDEDTPLDLISALRPDVLVKGADYTLDQVVGADLVRSWGGRVLLARLEPGFSTTATIARIAE